MKDTQGYSAYELYATKLLRVEEPVSETCGRKFTQLTVCLLP